MPLDKMTKLLTVYPFLIWVAAADAQVSAVGQGVVKSVNHRVDASAHAPLISFDPVQKRLVYGKYADNADSRRTGIIPDFSRAGYEGGGVALPSPAAVPIRRTIDPGDHVDDVGRIQRAIDDVSELPPDENGIRGAVLVKSGQYSLSSTLYMNVSGVILRGEGRGANGTVLRSAIRDRKGVIIEVGRAESTKPRAAAQSLRTPIVSGPVPVGATRIEVSDAKGYSVGDKVAVVRTPNARWVSADGIDTARLGWDASKYVMYYERTVTHVHANIVSLDAPIVDSIDDRFGGGYLYRIDPIRARHIGIEDLRIEGDPNTGEANGTPDVGPYFGIRLGGVKNSWVRNVTIRFVSHGLATRNGAHFNTFQDIAYIDPRYGATQGGRRYAFLYEGNSSFNLTQRCYAEKARHAYVTGSRVPGPNVFLDSEGVDSSSDSGPHHRWATGTLYDNIRDDLLTVQNRGRIGRGHGWAGAQQMFWNSKSNHFTVQSPKFAMNWSIGQSGSAIEGRFSHGEAAGIQQRSNQIVEPRSLYIQQIYERSGGSAVKAVTTDRQRVGRVWGYLKDNGGSAR